MIRTHDEALALIEAHKQKKVIQSGTPDIWTDFDGSLESLLYCLGSINWINTRWRIKPTPSKRLIRADELPKPCYIRNPESEVCTTVITYGKDYLTYVNKNKELESFPIGVLAASQFSSDGKVWRSFYVEES